MRDQNNNQQENDQPLARADLYDILDRWIELEFAKNDTQKEQIQQSHNLARENLQFQLQDRKDWRAVWYSAYKLRFLVGVVLVAFVLLFIGVAMYLDKDQIALELVKLIGTGALAGFGGYAIGRYRQIQQNDH